MKTYIIQEEISPYDGGSICAIETDFDKVKELFDKLCRGRGGLRIYVIECPVGEVFISTSIKPIMDSGY